jgi:hypothetical protein
MAPPQTKPGKTSSGATTPVDEINYRCEAKETKMHFKYYLDDQERRELISTKGIGEAGCLLFEFYLRLAAKGEVHVSDAIAAHHFGWQTQKTQRLRLGLTNSGWFRQVRSTFTDGRKGITYYVGKVAVQQSLNSSVAMKTPKKPATKVSGKVTAKNSTPRPTMSLFNSPT